MGRFSLQIDGVEVEGFAAIAEVQLRELTISFEDGGRQAAKNLITAKISAIICFYMERGLSFNDARDLTLEQVAVMSPRL
jgi:hypothetical protein